MAGMASLVVAIPIPREDVRKFSDCETTMWASSVIDTCLEC